MYKALILDDSESIRMELRAILEELHYEVLEGSNGRVGLELARKNPDLKLIVTDLNMPEINGLEFCKLLHEAKIFAKTPPIAMVTTDIDANKKKAAKELGVVAWVIKPYVAAQVKAFFAKLSGIAPHA